MAEVTISNKKQTGKPDMTPLLDLGFLLITFFIYTSTFTTPSMMDFVSPSAEDKNFSSIKEKNTLTVLLGAENRVYWYQKPLKELVENDIHETDYSPRGLRLIIAEKKSQALDPEMWTVIIKPSDKATWQNTVDVLDETVITASDKKMVTELTALELASLESFISRN